MISRRSVVLPVPAGPHDRGDAPAARREVDACENRPAADRVVHVAHVDDRIGRRAAAGAASVAGFATRAWAAFRLRPPGSPCRHRSCPPPRARSAGRAWQTPSARQRSSRVAAPGLERVVLQRAPVAEGQRPGQRLPILFMSDRCRVASSGDWPPERNAMPGTAGGTCGAARAAWPRQQSRDRRGGQPSCPRSPCWA